MIVVDVRVKLYLVFDESAGPDAREAYGVCVYHMVAEP